MGSQLFKRRLNHTFSPLHAIDSTGPIEFELPPIRNSAIYKIGQCILSARVKLLSISQDGSVGPPGTSAEVALKNNSLNTLFSKSLIKVNDVPGYKDKRKKSSTPVHVPRQRNLFAEFSEPDRVSS